MLGYLKLKESPGATFFLFCVFVKHFLQLFCFLDFFGFFLWVSFFTKTNDFLTRLKVTWVDRHVPTIILIYGNLFWTLFGSLGHRDEYFTTKYSKQRSLDLSISQKIDMFCHIREKKQRICFIYNRKSSAKTGKNRLHL